MRVMKSDRGFSGLPSDGHAPQDGESKFCALAETLASAIFITAGARLLYANHAAETITGYTRDELLCMNLPNFLHPDPARPGSGRRRQRRGMIPTGSPHEVRILAKNGDERWLDVSTGMIRFAGVAAQLVSAFDLTERKKAEDRVQHLTLTDPLTGLGNYRHLMRVLDAEVKRSSRTGRPFAVLLLDLDGLKRINDRYGHLAGSKALCRIGEVLREDCRAIDTAARYGGDEFVLILPETAAAPAELVAARICERLANDGQFPAVSISIGIAVFPRDGGDMEALLRRADRELYGMKSRGGQRPAPFVCAPVVASSGLASKRNAVRRTHRPEVLLDENPRIQ